MTLPGEVVQISCGPGELVWAVLWEGQLIVREGISRDCPKGTPARRLEEVAVNTGSFLNLLFEKIFVVFIRDLLDGGGLTQS